MAVKIKFSVSKCDAERGSVVNLVLHLQLILRGRAGFAETGLKWLAEIISRSFVHVNFIHSAAPEFHSWRYFYGAYYRLRPFRQPLYRNYFTIGCYLRSAFNIGNPSSYCYQKLLKCWN